MYKTLGITAILIAAGAAQATPVAQFTAINGGGFFGSYDNSVASGGRSAPRATNNDIAYLLARAYGVNAPLGTVGTRVDTAGRGVDLAGGGYTFTRVADYYVDGGVVSAGQRFNLHNYNLDTASDQAFQDGTTDVNARVLYSGASQVVGFRNNNTNVDTQMFNLGPQLNFNLNVTFQASFGTDFSFYRDNDTNSGSGRVRSNVFPAGQPNGGDSFIAYVVTSTDSSFAPRLVIGVDDALAGDVDYQDFIFEVSLVPNPLAAHGALAGLAGMGVLGFRRRRA